MAASANRKKINIKKGNILRTSLGVKREGEADYFPQKNNISFRFFLMPSF